MTLSEAARARISAVATSLGPAPPDNPAAAAKVKAIVDKYNQRYEDEMKVLPKRSGLNMVLPKEVVGGEAVAMFGHVPGVHPGTKFRDRGQLYVAGVHVTLMKGIHAPPVKHPDFAKGAYSVVMSGGYVDDEDMGESFWYTGEGGVGSAKRQVKDQSMERGANAALRNNCDSGTPVRVVRGFVSTPGEDRAAGAGPGGAASGEGAGDARSSGGGSGRKEKGFYYEGLYVVLEYKLGRSKDGPKVCKFLLHGVPGHSVVNSKVEFGIFGGASTGSRLHARRLAAPAGGAGAGPSSSQGPAKRPRVARGRQVQETARKVMLAEIRNRYRSCPSVLLCEDVSGGTEPVPIPLVNEVNSETLPPGFHYIRDYTWAPGVYELVRPILRFLDEEMAQFTNAQTNGQCGLAFNSMIADKDRQLAGADKLPPGYEPHLEEQYSSAGCLLVTDPCGVHECGPSCTSARCRLNKQLTTGVQVPLEVFMTAAKGWGVRCREPIPAGAFVCCYVGQLLSDHLAEGRKGADHYLFNLDFFAHIYTEISEKGLESIEQEIPLHKIPPVLPVSAIRQLQANAARDARTRKAADDDAAGAGPSNRQPGGAAAAATAAAGVLSPEAVRAAAQDLLSSYSAVASAGTHPDGSGDGARQPSEAGNASFSAIVAEAAALAAAAEDDPGAFYLAHIIGRDEPPLPAPAAVGMVPRVGVESVLAAAATADDEEYSPVLVLDALKSGNVGRFINHSCDGNLTIQAVFAGSCRNTFLYHVGLYACTDIPAMTELTYNYGYHSQASRGTGRYGMECHCGAPNCVGQLM